MPIKLRIWALATFLGSVSAHRVKHAMAYRVHNELSDTESKAWSMVCNGYIKGDHAGRQGHGAYNTDFIGAEKCKEKCEKYQKRGRRRCNFVTYDEGSGKCWLESMRTIPRDNCKTAKNAWSYWLDDPTSMAKASITVDTERQIATHIDKELDLKSTLPAGWHLFCHGNVVDNTTWSQRLGEPSEKIVDKFGCMEACNKVKGCDFMTYDSRAGKCLMQQLHYMPVHCDSNDAAWSYVHHKADELMKMELMHGGSQDGWHFVCDGYVKGHSLVRTGFGKAEDLDQGAGHSGCKAACNEQKGCNFVTYDAWSGTCWMEHIEVMPHVKDCDENSAGWSYWNGKLDGSWIKDEIGATLDVAEELALGWHLFCHGYVADKTSWHTGFGAASEQFLGKPGCMAACDAHGLCNFVTYDTLSGTCWMEKITHMPTGCDNNDAGWSYVHHDADELLLMQLEFSGNADGWHFVCDSYVGGEQKDRKGYGQAEDAKGSGHEGCKAACDKHDGCNFVTYDAWRGVCWMEHIGEMPHAADCDENAAGWSYWRGHIDDAWTSQELQGHDDWDTIVLGGDDWLDDDDESFEMGELDVGDDE